MSRLFIPSLALATMMAAMPAGDTTPGFARRRSALIRLSAIDALTASLNFETMAHASTIEDGQVDLDQAHLVYNLLEEDALSMGFVRKQLIKVVDLGDVTVDGYIRPEDLAPHPALSIFHTLTVRGTQVFYEGPLAKSYRLKQAEKIFQSFGPEGIFHIMPELGHTYLVRYAPRGAQSSQDRFAKFRVIDIEPGRYIILRVARIDS